MAKWRAEEEAAAKGPADADDGVDSIFANSFCDVDRLGSGSGSGSGRAVDEVDDRDESDDEDDVDVDGGDDKGEE